MSDDFYPFVDSGQPAPDNTHLVAGATAAPDGAMDAAEQATFACRIAVYDDMLSTPRVIVVGPKDVRSYLEEVTNTVYRCMKEQGGSISLMVIREIVENFIHAHFAEPIISVLDGGATIRFADQGPGIADKERAFEFGVTSADRDKKKYIRGTGAGFPMVQQYLENAGGAVSIEDNLGQGTVVTVSTDPARVAEIERSAARGAAVRGAHAEHDAGAGTQDAAGIPPQAGFAAERAGQLGGMYPGALTGQTGMPGGYPPQGMPQQGAYPGMQAGAPQQQGYPGAQAWQSPAQQAWGQQVGGAYPAAGYQQPGWNPYPGTAPAFGAGWPQQGAYPQQQAWGGAAYPAAPAGAWNQAAPQPVQVTDRGQMALAYLAANGICGPTDLVHAYGSSAPTWSRELETLTQMGLTMKSGQKRVLTDMGRHWLAEQAAPQAAQQPAVTAVPPQQAPTAAPQPLPAGWPGEPAAYPPQDPAATPAL